MTNSVIMVRDNGYGETPACPVAKFKPGNCVRVRSYERMGTPQFGYVAVVVPPNFPAEWALADAAGGARPLMHRTPLNVVSYLVGFPGLPRSSQIRETSLIKTDRPDGKVLWA